MIPSDEREWTMRDYSHMLARLLQHQRGKEALSFETIILIRAFEWRHGIRN